MKPLGMRSRSSRAARRVALRRTGARVEIWSAPDPIVRGNASLDVLVTDPSSGLLATTLLIASCFVSSSQGDCPTNLPTCPSSNAPSYATDVAPILAQQCVGCHSPGGSERVTPLDTYAHVFKYRGPVLDQVYACKMPLAAPLTASDRQALLTWLSCGAANN